MKRWNNLLARLRTITHIAPKHLGFGNASLTSRIEREVKADMQRRYFTWWQLDDAVFGSSACEQPQHETLGRNLLHAVTS